MGREKPDDAEWYGWNNFEYFADENGIGEIAEDWQVWWECWKQGYIAAMNGA